MADEFVFEFLHMEIVSYFEKQTEEDDVNFMFDV